MNPAYLVGIGGALGALARHAVYVLSRRGGYVPHGTLTVNALGSLVLGYVTFAGLNGDALLFVGTGVCGAFTTFSSFSFETFQLWEAGERQRAIVNAVGNLVASLGAVGLGWLLAG